MNTEELTQIATAHQQAITRHEQEMAEIRAILRQSAIQHAQQMESITAQINSNSAQISSNSAQIDRISAQQALNQQAIAELTASITELRNLVSDYLQGRSQAQ